MSDKNGKKIILGNSEAVIIEKKSTQYEKNNLNLTNGDINIDSEDKIKSCDYLSAINLHSVLHSKPIK